MKRYPALSAIAFVCAAAQGLLAGRVFLRIARTANGVRVRAIDDDELTDGMVSMLIPVLNEVHRLPPCLQSAIAQGSTVAEILVIDGGSIDGTQALVEQYACIDNRIRLVDASPVPAEVNGKAYGLQIGTSESATNTIWWLTLDADVVCHPSLTRSLVTHARCQGVAALSVATKQRLSGDAEGLLHPAMLTTLVYRFGIPGHATDRIDAVQANGQCMLVAREALNAAGGFSTALQSVNEDVTVARAIAATGRLVGFYESNDLVSVQMYSGWREAWHNWTRSLPMRDRYSEYTADRGLVEVLCIQALAPYVALGAWKYLGRKHPLTIVNLALAIARVGVLCGTARAYSLRPWTYWLSPIADLPVALKLIITSRRKSHQWRGRTIVTGGS